MTMMMSSSTVHMAESPRDVVGGVADALVGVRVNELVHACVGLGEGTDHVLLGIGALGHREAAVTEAERVGVGRRAARVLERPEAGLGNLGHAIGDGVDREVGVVGKQRLAVGLRHDADDGIRASGERDLVPDGEAVVGGKDAVDGNLVVSLRDAPLAVGGEVDLGAVRVGAQRAARAVVALRLAEARVNGEVLVDVDAADAVRGVACGVELGLGGLEARGEAAVLYCVLVAHAVDDDADGVRGEKKARGQGDGGAHEEEDADVLAQVVAQLPGEAPC